MNDNRSPPLAYRPKDAAVALGVSRSLIFEMIAEGRLEARKLGTATVIPYASLAAVLAGAPLAEATKRAHSEAS